jgi:hypothetical protein
LKEILGDVMTFGAEVKEKDPRDSYEVTWVCVFPHTGVYLI